MPEMSGDNGESCGRILEAVLLIEISRSGKTL